MIDRYSRAISFNIKIATSISNQPGIVGFGKIIVTSNANKTSSSELEL
jgi:hypothetical protein